MPGQWCARAAGVRYRLMKILNMRLGSAAVAAMLALAAGCAAPKQADLSATETDDTGLSAAELGATGPAIENNGYRLLSHERTSGRFPCSIAVTKLKKNASDSRERQFEVATIRAPAASRWNTLLDLDPLVREVGILGKYGLPLNYVSIDDLLKESSRLGYALTVIYSESGDEGYVSEQVGVMWDNRTRTPLAVFQSSATGDPDAKIREGTPEHDDPRVLVAGFVARKALHQLAASALWELASQDDRSTTTQPSPWNGERPYMPMRPLRAGDVMMVPADTRR